MPEEWADAADEDYKPAFAVFVTVLALAGFMCLFSLCASIFPKLRNPYSQWFSEAMALFIGALALGASARTTDTYLTVADNYIDGCVGTQSHGAAGFITGNICWILGLSIFLLTALPFTKCLLAAADEVVDAAEGVVTGRV